MQQNKDESMKTLDVIAIRIKQHDKDIYAFSLDARTIHDLLNSKKMDIDRWSPTNQDGYQRNPTDTRYKKFGKFVLRRDGISPLSILLSIRNKEALELEPIHGQQNVFHLKIKLKDAIIYLPDGQHRAYGLRWAVDMYPGEVDNYQLPAVLFIAGGEDPRYEEAQQFYLINTLGKRVKTDLAQRYILRTKEKAQGTLTETVIIPEDSIKDLDPYALKISDMLNADGPLAGMISLPNSNTLAISQNSFIDSIKPLLIRAAELHWSIGKARDTLAAFWGAIKDKCPRSFSHWDGDGCSAGNPEHFNAVLVKTSGMYSLNAVLAKSLLLPEVSKAPTEKETFKKLLDTPELETYFGEDGLGGYWSSSNTGGAAGRGTSRKSFKDISDEIWSHLVEE